MVAAQLVGGGDQREIGAGKGEVSPDRMTHRNGYRPRVWETRVGDVELQIPCKRSAEAYFPSFLEAGRLSEQVVAVAMEAYVSGVSTRQVDRLVEQLGVDGMTKDRVSALCRAVDQQVRGLRIASARGRASLHVARRESGEGTKPRPRLYEGARDSLRRAEVIGLDIGGIESEAYWVGSMLASRARPCGRSTLDLRRKERAGEMIERLTGPAPKVAELLAEAEDLLAFDRLPSAPGRSCAR